MKIGLFTDALPDRSLPEALDWLREHAPSVSGVEIATGGYSPAPHCRLSELVEDAAARSAWLETITSRGFELVALNVSGNPLHPDAEVGRRHASDLKATLRLAEALGVGTIVCMSGCPGADRTPIFSGGGWLPDLVGIAETQWRETVAPFWREVLGEAARSSPGVTLCFELHPGTFVYNTATFLALAELGDNVAVNLDPSHFFWQGIDPLEVIWRLGPRIGHAHGKDTQFNDDQLALNGVLDNRWPGDPAEMPWNFATVGRGHDREWWSAFADALSRHGTRASTISIEFEDPFVPAEESIVESAATLAEAIRDGAAG